MKNPLFKLFPTETKEYCAAIAKDFKFRSELKKANRHLFNVCKYNGWLDDFFPFNGDRTFHGKGVNEDGSATYRKLTESTCKEIASKYAKYSDLRDNDFTVYTKCKNNGWLEELGLINDIPPQHRNYTADEIIEAAKRYDNARDFRLKDSKIYGAAKRRGMLSTFTWMTLPRKIDQAPYFKDFIYVYEFVETNVAYVGRTIQPEIRHLEHCKEGDSVADYARSIGVPVPEPKYLFENITVAEGRVRENEMIEKYKNDGWSMLNKRRGGGIGGLIGKWDKKTCIEFCRQFTTRGEVDAANHTVYGRMLTKGWFDETPWIKKPYEAGREHHGRVVLIYTPDGKTLLKRCNKLKEAVKFAGCHTSTIQYALAGKNNGVACGYLFKDGVPVDDVQREKFAESLKKRAEKNKAWREANQDTLTEKRKAYYQTNKQNIAEKDRAYRKANKEKRAEKNKAWREAKIAAGYRYRKNPLTGKYGWIFVGLPGAKEVA